MSLFRLSKLTSRVNIRFSPQIYRLSSVKGLNTAPPDKNDELDVPVKFSSSSAKQWKAKTTREGLKEPRLWYEPYIIITSFTIFMVYFTLLREENDIDEELTHSLYNRIQGLEEYQLRASLQYNRDHNIDTAPIIQRLNEIEQERAIKTL